MVNSLIYIRTVIKTHGLILCRQYSEQVRVRFAPSPTGYLHVGGLRTALFNYLYAKSHKGKFILRIEDTDRKRLVSGAVSALESDLLWAGVIPDEGPSQGGDFGPYIQSERLELYKAEVEKLLSSGAAYWCFCSEKRLDLLRKYAVQNQTVPKYDNRCRQLSKSEIEEKLSNGVEKCLRFKMTKSEKFVDLVYGEYFHDVAEIEGDPVILKKDGYPTYHLANVIDDHRMKISHVIRGVEWLQSTPKHIMLYKAFGYDVPQFAHLPLIVNPDGTKLSKRQGDVSVGSYRSRGILPSALVTFLMAAGSGFPHNFHLSSKTFSEMTDAFDISLVNPHPCKLNLERLPDYNREELIKQIKSPQKASVISEVTKLVLEHFPNMTSNEELDDYVSEILEWCGPRITYLNDLVGPNFRFLWTSPNYEDLSVDSSGILKKILSALEKMEFKKELLLVELKDLSKRESVPFKQLMKIMRTALCGLKEGPSVAEMLELLGKKSSLDRISSAVKYLSEK